MDDLKLNFYYELWSLYHAVDEDDWDRLNIKEKEENIKNLITKITKNYEDILGDLEPTFLDLDDELYIALITHLKNKDKKITKIITEMLFKTYLI